MLTSICLYVPQAQGRPTLEHVDQKSVLLEYGKLRYLRPADPHFPLPAESSRLHG